MNNDIYSYQVFNFLHPVDYPSAMLTCKSWYHAMKESDGYLYYTMILHKNGLTKHFPDANFFSTNHAQNLLHFVHDKRAIYLKPVCLLMEHNESLKQLMQVMHFDIEPDSIYSRFAKASGNPWLMQIWEELTCLAHKILYIRNMPSSSIEDSTDVVIPECIQLLEKYQSFKWVLVSQRMEISMVDVLIMLSTHPLVLRKSWIIEMLKLRPEMYSQLADHFRNDPDIIMSMSFKAHNVYSQVDKTLLRRKDIFMHVLKTGASFIMEDADETFRDDREVVLTAVSNSGIALKYASDRLKADKEIAFAALMNNLRALPECAPIIVKDREFMLKVIRSTTQMGDGVIYRNLPDHLTKDRELILALASNYGLTQIPNHFKDDKEVCQNVLICYPNQFAQISESFRGDRGFVIDCLQKGARIYKHLPEKLKRDKQVVLNAVEHAGAQFSDIPVDLQRYQEIVIASVRKRGSTLQHLPDNLREDRKIVREAVMQDLFSLSSAPQRFTDDRDFIMDVIQSLKKQNYMVLFFASDRLKNCKEVVKAAVQKSGYALRYAPVTLKSDEELVLEAIAGDLEVNDFVSVIPESLQQNTHFLERAIQRNPKVIMADFIPIELIHKHGKHVLDLLCS